MLSVMVPLLVCFLFTSLTTTFSAAAAAADTYNISKSGAIAKRGCPSKCGNLTVPFPFGIGIDSGCALNSDFAVNCTDTFSPSPPRAFIGDMQIFEISDSRMRTATAVSGNCYDITGSSVLENRAFLDTTGTPFSLSDLNKFTIIGCDEFGILAGGGGSANQTGACASVCSNAEEVADGVCSGKGCCQTSIIKGGQFYLTGLSSLNNHTSVFRFNPCGYSFIGEQGSFAFRSCRCLSLSLSLSLSATANLYLSTGAFSYLHSAASTPIIHRDVKSTNILLDAYYTAKISDFGASRLIPLDQNKVTTMLIGTFGYLDPEYFHTSHLTEKSDVYSFGVVLIELLTGRKPVDMARSEDQRSLTACFVTHLKENRLFQILEARVVREGSLEQLQAMAELVKRCLHLNREERPTMKEVATELEALRKFTTSSWTDSKTVDQETEGGVGLTDLYTVSVSPYGSTGEFSSSYSSQGQ